MAVGHARRPQLENRRGLICCRFLASIDDNVRAARVLGLSYPVSEGMGRFRGVRRESGEREKERREGERKVECRDEKGEKG